MWRSPLSRKRSEASIGHTSPANASTDSLPKSSAALRRETTPSRTTLTEILKNNPFRLSTKDATQTTQPQYEDPVQLLNKDLIRAATIYPDVQLDVLRELLFRFDGESRLQVCVEQLFRYKSEWARGRLLNPPRDPDDVIPTEELFRDQHYVAACKKTLYNEFKALNKSAIDAVLAEINNSYTKARPTLQEIAAKTWRATLTSFFRKKKGDQEPPSFLIGRGLGLEQRLLSTGNAELDTELHGLFFTASNEVRNVAQKENDYDLATQLNREQAEEVGALFECQCCFDEITFEQITTCVAEGHVLCVECVRRTLNEALFGQSWSKSVDASLATLTCFAPLLAGQCGSHIQYSSLVSAITNAKSGDEVWSKFEQRLATETLTRANLPLQSCPFCPYAEVRESHTMQTVSSIRWRLRFEKFTLMTTGMVIISFVNFVILALIMMFVTAILIFVLLPPHTFQQSLANICQQRQTHKFKCRSPQCGKTSCTVCHKQWHDPHVCHEPLILSLRNTVEAARTAALKRVCPRCGMGFVKSSGCNKLVCICGYAMCYLCRKNIGKVPASPADAAPVANWNFNIGNIGRNQAQEAEDADIVAAGEGYRHFCPHFRPLPGQKCTECDKCDLYKTEDEDAVIRCAGEVAEQEWREKYERDIGSQASHSKADFAGLDRALEGIDDHDYNYAWYFSKRVERMVWKVMSDIRQGRFDAQAVVDWVVERMVMVEDAER